MRRTIVRYRNSRLRKESRTIPLPGSDRRGNGEDAGKYYRCWNCNFICNVDRDALGDSQSGDGMTYTDSTAEAYGGLPDDAGQASLDGPQMGYEVALQLGSDGTPQDIYHNYEPIAARGCPFCGTLNWRGDYP